MMFPAISLPLVRLKTTDTVLVTAHVLYQLGRTGCSTHTCLDLLAAQHVLRETAQARLQWMNRHARLTPVLSTCMQHSWRCRPIKCGSQLSVATALCFVLCTRASEADHAGVAIDMCLLPTYYRLGSAGPAVRLWSGYLKCQSVMILTQAGCFWEATPATPSCWRLPGCWQKSLPRASRSATRHCSGRCGDRSAPHTVPPKVRSDTLIALSPATCVCFVRRCWSRTPSTAWRPSRISSHLRIRQVRWHDPRSS